MKLIERINQHIESIIAIASDEELALMRTIAIFDNCQDESREYLFNDMPTRAVLRVWALDKNSDGMACLFMLEKLYNASKRHLRAQKLALKYADV